MRRPKRRRRSRSAKERVKQPIKRGFVCVSRCRPVVNHSYDSHGRAPPSLSLSALWPGPGRGGARRGEEASKVCFSGPLASFVGKNFDTRQDACWGQLRDEAVCSPLVNSRRWRH